MQATKDCSTCGWRDTKPGTGEFARQEAQSKAQIFYWLCSFRTLSCLQTSFTPVIEGDKGTRVTQESAQGQQVFPN